MKKLTKEKLAELNEIIESLGCNLDDLEGQISNASDMAANIRDNLDSLIELVGEVQV
jgi:hypothetical protein